MINNRLNRLKFKVRRKLKMISIEFRFHKKRLTNKKVPKKLRLEHFKNMVTRTCSRKGSGCSGGRAYIKHSNCAYVDELSNYKFLCEECHEEIDAMYQEWWDEYNSGRL